MNSTLSGWYGHVRGLFFHQMGKSCYPEILSRNLLVKRNRNYGYSYKSKKSKRPMPAWRNTNYNSLCRKCPSRGLSCHRISHKDHVAVRGSFFLNLCVLKAQRGWIGRLTEKIPARQPKKLCKFGYFLANSMDPFQKFPVCQKIFLTTLRISSRQVKTVFAKKKPCGLIEGEKQEKLQCDYQLL